MLVVSQWANVGLFQWLHNRITEEVTFINGSLTYKPSLTKCPWYVCSVISVLVSLLVLITNIVLLDAKKQLHFWVLFFSFISLQKKTTVKKSLISIHINAKVSLLKQKKWRINRWTPPGCAAASLPRCNAIVRLIQQGAPYSASASQWQTRIHNCFQSWLPVWSEQKQGRGRLLWMCSDYIIRLQQN